MQRRPQLSVHIPTRLLIATGAMAAIAFAASCAEQQVTGPTATLPISASTVPTPTSSGCRSFQVTLGAGNAITVDSVALSWCGGFIKGTLRPEVSGTPTFDRTSGTVRIPIVLRNTDTTSVGALVRTVSVEDSVFIITPTGIRNWGTGGPYVHFTNWDSAMTRGGEWHYTPVRSGTVAPQYLPPKTLSQVKWVQMHVLSSVSKYQFMLWGTAPMASSSKVRFVLDSGISGHPSVDTVVPRGSVIPYAFTVASGFTAPLILQDATSIALSGTIVVDTDRVIEASAQKPLVVTPQIQPLVNEVHALLSASDPVSAFQTHITHALTLYNQVGATEAVRQLTIAYDAGMDPIRDSAALRRLNAALNGHAFIIVPRTDSTHPLASRVSASRVRTDALASVVPGLSTDSAEMTTYVYVNGIFTNRDQPELTTQSLRGLLDEISELNTPRRQVTWFYNASQVSPPTTDQDVFNECALAASPYTDYPGGYDRAFWNCVNQLHSPPSFDLVESVRQYVALHQNALAPETDAIRFATFLSTLHAAGEHIIIVPHSQGSMITQQAVQWLVDNHKYDVNRDSACIGVVPLASPVSVNWPVGPNYLKQVSVAGDAVANLNGWPKTSTPLSTEADDVLSDFAPGAYQYAKNWIFWRTQVLHSVDHSYLGQAAPRQLIKDGLHSIYRECTVGKVTQNFSSDILQVGASRLVAPYVEVDNRNGRQIYGRKFQWWSTNPAVASVDTGGTWRAISAGTAKIISRSWQDTGAVIANVNPAPPKYTSIVGHYVGTYQSRQYYGIRGNADLVITGAFTGTLTYVSQGITYSGPVTGTTTPFIPGVQYGTASFTFYSSEFAHNFFCSGQTCPYIGTFHFDDTYSGFGGQTLPAAGQPPDARDWNFWRAP